jgi:pyruvate-formate lyase-activating enzyme
MAGTLDERAMRKAQLLEAGYVYAPADLEFPGRIAHSTAGPDAGERAVVLDVDGLWVRVRLSDDPSREFALSRKGESLELERHGESFAPGVRVVPNVMHAPGMAFVNVESGCAMDCKFCATPHLRRESRKRVRKEQWLQTLIEAAHREDVRSIGITAGVSGIPGKTVDDIVWIVSELRKVHPDIPVGVEPYVESVEEIRRIQAAGATELKLNLQTFDRDIFARVCPGWDFDRQLEMLRAAAGIFGKERVTANLLVGLGESDENVEAGLRFLFGIGVVPTVRALRWNDINREHLEEALGGPVPPVSAERLLRLAQMEHRMLMDAGLSSLHYRTMCHACGACDMVPERDLLGVS